MKHWTPRIADAAERALESGADTVVGLVLAPHWSELSIAGYREQLESALGGRAELVFVDSWHDKPGFVELLADRVRGMGRARRLHRHSLPARAAPVYREQLLETAQLVAERAGWRTGRSPSRASRRQASPGSARTFLDHLEDLHARGVRKVLVCPVGFVADHLEIRWDLDHEQQRRRRSSGSSSRASRCPTPNRVSSASLAGLVRKALAVPSEA
jgi:ferrochelatase